MKRILIVLVAALLLSGCASSGNRSLDGATDESISSMLSEGVTKKEEVKSSLGSPMSVAFMPEGKEMWVYSHASFSSDARNFIPFMALLGTSGSGETRTLQILFDDNDVLERYAFSNADTQYGTGIFR